MDTFIFCMFLFSICIIELAYIIYEDKQHLKERQDLYNRLMARNFSEYTAQTRESIGKSKNFVQESIERAHKIRMNELE